MLKKIFKFIFSRPELDGIVLGLLIAGIPFLFSGGAIPAAQLLKAELPELDNWQLYLFAGIPAGAVITSLCSRKFRFSAGGKNISALIRSAAAGIAGGVFAAAGLLISEDIVWNRAASAANLYGSGWLFLAGMLFTAVLLTQLWNNRSKPADKEEKK